MRSSRFLVAIVLALSTLVTSSPEPTGIAVPPHVLPRQDSTATGRPTAGSGTGVRGSEAADSDAPASTGSRRPTTTRRVSIPATAQVGRVEMVTPGVMDGYQIYKIGETLTFAWNYTDVKVTPTAINVVAFCQDNQHDFTITGNVSAQQTKVLWDTGEYQSTATVKLLLATYTLNIFDASKPKTAAPTAGYLSTFNGYQFGMYSPKGAIPLKDFVCATCDPNDASRLNAYALKMSIGLGFLAVASFTWFLAGLVP